MSLPAPRRIGPLSVSPLGLGCMNLSHAYGTSPSTNEAATLLLAALDAGVSLLDTAALYGFGGNESLVGAVLAPHRHRFVLASKCGLHGVEGKRVIDGRPATIKASCDASLQRLRTDHIDLFYLHRWDKTVPIEDSVGAMADLVQAGKVRLLGLSEVSAATLLKAHAVHPISAVQTEYSLWTREPEIAVLAACRRIGAAFVAFSPLARAFLTGTLRDVATLEPKDIRRGMPRFEPGTYAQNLGLLPAYEALALEVGCTPAQLALAWLLAKGEDIIPIPGTRSLAHLHENLGAWHLALSSSLVERLDALINQHTVAGPRYTAATTAEIDTELF
ncbi:MAG: aldo/keto reductase [Rubrivivax sp.]|nr:aldo/keto reductase [Rubrivivax sp.]